MSGMDGGKGRPAWKRRAGKVHYIRRGGRHGHIGAGGAIGESATKACRQEYARNGKDTASVEESGRGREGRMEASGR